MFDVITFGSATRDSFLRLKKENYRILSEGQFPEKKSLCFPLGAKIFIESLEVASGGGATNTACTFSNQDFKVAVLTKIGDDKRGEAVMADLKRFNVDSRFIKKDKKIPTAYSVILTSLREDRTVLIYRGACHFVKTDELPLEKLKETKWFYLAPLSEESSQLFEPLVNFAKANNIKVACNPGSSQINLGKDILKPILSKIDILLLNLEEAALMTGVDIEDEKNIIKKLNDFIGEGIVVVTKGKKGSIASDGKYIFGARAPSVLPFEKTGAGDAFGAGFVSGLLEKNNIEYALQLATANATNCIQKVGAKNGLLKKGEWGSWPRVKVEKQTL